MKINKIYRSLILEGNDYGYFRDRSGVPDYDDILMGDVGKLPKKYMGWVGEIRYMSKEEYFGECSKLQGTSYSDQFRYIIPEKVKEIANKMRGGTRYNLPYLNYVDKSQEGRHRVMAASSLGQDSFPILVLRRDNGGDNSSSNISDMLGRWKDLVEIGGVYYLRIVDNGNWKRIGRLLSCIVSNYDYYYLDILFDGKRSRGVIDVNDILFKLIKDDEGVLSYIRGDEINYDEYNESKKILMWCVILRALRNNSDVISDAVMIRGGSFYLRVLDLRDNFEEYESCESMLLSLVDRGDYVREYNLLSVDEGNELYSISDKDIVIVKGLFDKLNKGY